MTENKIRIYFLLLFLIAGTLPAFASHKTKSIPYGTNPKAGHYQIVNDVKIYYEVYGKGRPVMLLHGNGGSIEAFRNQIPGLSKKFMVIAVDSRAHGKSYDSDKELTFALMASDMAALIDSLHLDSVYVMGWSDGGNVGLEMAYAFPQKVRKLITSGANFIPDSTALPQSLIDDAKRDRAAEPDSGGLAYVRRLSPQPELARERRYKWIDLDLKYPNFTLEQLRSIKTPVLVMAGDHDLIKHEHSLALFRALPNSQLCIVPGSTHGVVIDRPDYANKVIADFFSLPFKKLN
jgi:pimeloyl-ACP methyl ester carboxylesterase